MRTRINYVILTLISILFASIPCHARQKTTILMRNGSRITGDIIVQRPGKDMTIAATKAVLVIHDGDIRSKKDKNIRYENLAREWKRWAMESKALKGSADGRYLAMSSITTKDNNYSDIVNAGKRDVYLQLVPTTFTVRWADIAEIRREIPSEKETKGVDDEVETTTGRTYRGTIVVQKIGQTLSVQNNSATVDVSMSKILEIRKVARVTSQPLYDQAGFTNTLVMKDGTLKDGIVTVQHYGTKAKDQYVILSHKDGTKEKLQAANVVEYRTEYANREEQIYQTGRVYVNEFVIARARTRTENGVTAYVDKTVFPFPEGIVTTFKAVGAKFQRAWHLIALEQVELANGIETQGYTTKTRTTNSIEPSTVDMSGGVSSLSFTYLSPGFYALVNDHDTETYIIKITK